jgi:hypothetical protein
VNTLPRPGEPRDESDTFPRGERALAHDLDRVLAGLTIGVVRGKESADTRRREMSLGETMLQFQVPINGEGGTQVATDSFDLDFDTPFHFAPGQRDSDFDTPQYTAGVQLDGGAGVNVDVHVRAWKRDPDTDAVTGATVEVSTVAPGTLEPVPFNGLCHLTFQGYGALHEDESEMA